MMITMDHPYSCKTVYKNSIEAVVADTPNVCNELNELDKRTCMKIWKMRKNMIPGSEAAYHAIIVCIEAEQSTLAIKVMESYTHGNSSDLEIIRSIGLHGSEKVKRSQYLKQFTIFLKGHAQIVSLHLCISFIHFEKNSVHNLDY